MILVLCSKELNLVRDFVEECVFCKKIAFMTTLCFNQSFIISVHDFYPFALEDEARLVPLAVELAVRLATLIVARRFRPGRMGASSAGHRLRDESNARTNRFIIRRSTHFDSIMRQFTSLDNCRHKSMIMLQVGVEMKRLRMSTV
jgi:hypothetical protein